MHSFPILEPAATLPQEDTGNHPSAGIPSIVSAAMICSVHLDGECMHTLTSIKL